jgi:hypothetical protein
VKPRSVTINLDHDGRSYAIRLKRYDLPLPGGSFISHYEALDATSGRGVLFDLGNQLLKDSIDTSAAVEGASREAAQRAIVMAGLKDALPVRGRVLDRQVLRRVDRSATPTQLSSFADRLGRHYASEYLDVYRRHKRGEYVRDKGMDPGKFLHIQLEKNLVRHMREIEYRFLETPQEHSARMELGSVLSNPAASDHEKRAAQESLDRIELELVARYQQYREKLEELLSGKLTAEEVRLEVDRLRKAKNKSDRQAFARLLGTLSINASRYWPHSHAMQLVKKHLQARGKLKDVPSLAFYKFMHEPSELLSGIVPAAHGIGWLFVQSEFFRSALAAFSLQRIEGPRGKTVRNACNLYGAILGIAATYATRVHLRRAEDAHRLGKTSRPPSERIGAAGRAPDLSFEEDLGTFEVGPEAPHHPMGVTENEWKRAERDRRLEARGESPPSSTRRKCGRGLVPMVGRRSGRSYRQRVSAATRRNQSMILQGNTIAAVPRSTGG